MSRYFFPKLLLIICFQVLMLQHGYASSPYTHCFERRERYSMDNFQPIIELFQVSLQDCTDQCIQTTGNPHFVDPLKGICLAFVYDYLQHSCRLYDHDGFQIPAILHPANGFDFFRRTSATHGCAGPIQLLLARQKAKKATNLADQFKLKSFFVQKGSKTLVKSENNVSLPLVSVEPHNNQSPDNKEIKRRPIVLLKNSEPQQNITPHKPEKIRVLDLKRSKKYQYKGYFVRHDGSLKRPKYVQPTVTDSSESIAVIKKEEEKEKSMRTTVALENLPVEKHKKYIKPQKSQEKKPTIVQTDKDQSPTSKLEMPQLLEDNCPSSIGYFAVAGNEIALPMFGTTAPVSEENNIVVVPNANETECINYCSTNKDDEGRFAKCFSFNYFPLSKRCEIYGTLAEPHGKGSLMENEEAIYIEKFCLPNYDQKKITCPKDSLFPLSIQKSLDPAKIKPLASVSSRSIIDCLSSCLSTNNCKMASLDSSNNLCHLYDFSGKSSGNHHMAEKGTESSTQEWVMIENGCADNDNGASVERKRTMQELIVKAREKYIV